MEPNPIFKNIGTGDSALRETSNNSIQFLISCQRDILVQQEFGEDWFSVHSTKILFEMLI